MTVRQLIAKLQECNQDATVVRSEHVRYSEYTDGSEEVEISELITWPYDCELSEAKTIELA